MSILRYGQKIKFADGGVLRDSGGGGGGGTPVQQTVSNTQIPDYARPYVENMLGQAAALTDINQNPYQPYAGQRVAGFTPQQVEAFNRTANQQVASQIGEGSNLASQAGQTALGAWGQGQQLGQAALGYGASGARYGDIGAQQAAMAAQRASGQAQMYGAQGAGYGAGATGLGLSSTELARQQGLMYGAQGAGYGAQAAGMAGMGYGAGAQYAQQATSPQAMQAYMSPYMQDVVATQQREANRGYDIAAQAERASSVRSGAFGGSRQALMASENERNRQTALQNIQATGLQQAYQQAQQAQQFGAGLGLQGLQAGTAAQQAGIQGAGLGLQGLQGALAGSAQGLQGYQTGISGAQAGLQGVGQQLAAGNLGLAGTAQGIQGAQAGMQGVQGAIGAGQYGLQGLGVANQSASTLGALGQTQFGQETAITQGMASAGAQQQALQQRGLENQYQDYLTQMNYPYQQLGFMSNMLRGVPLGQQSTAVYQAAPSNISQLAGAGTALYAGSKMFKKGGSTKEKKGSGLAALQLHRLVGTK